LEALVEVTSTLKRLQEIPDPPEALATIPALALEDLPRRNKVIPIEVTRVAGAQVLYHDLATNGVLYVDLGFDLHVLPADLLPYVPLFARALLETGAGQQDFVGLSQRIGRTTGEFGHRFGSQLSSIRSSRPRDCSCGPRRFQKRAPSS